MAVRTRIIFAENPIIIMGNGLLLPDENTPSIMANRTFLTRILDELFVRMNAVETHKCSEFCEQVFSMVIGKPKELFTNAIPRNILHRMLIPHEASSASRH